jgi:hypothetical protein
MVAICSACNKDADLHGVAQDDIQAPQVNIIQPIAKDSVNGNGTIALKASVIENDQLHQYGYWVRNKATGEEYATFSKHQHTGYVAIDTNLTLSNITAGTTLSVQVYASDHTGNQNAKTIEVYVR